MYNKDRTKFFIVKLFISLRYKILLNISDTNCMEVKFIFFYE